jgi:hypothetical protein
MHELWRLPPHLGKGGKTTEKGGRRGAILLRTWDDHEYSDNRLAWLRALIAEASLQRNANYRVFFLVNVKDTDVAYDEMMRKCVLSEFRDMAFLFNEKILKAWYPQIQEHGWVMGSSVFKTRNANKHLYRA